MYVGSCCVFKPAAALTSQLYVGVKHPLAQAHKNKKSHLGEIFCLSFLNRFLSILSFVPSMGLCLMSSCFYVYTMNRQLCAQLRHIISPFTPYYFNKKVVRDFFKLNYSTNSFRYPCLVTTYSLSPSLL